MVDQPPAAAPHGRYRRGLDGADFTLECNTENVPADGRFYVLKGGQVVLETEDFEQATAEYTGMCREFWSARLEHESTPVRIAAAWGLLGLDSNNKEAQAIIQEFGSPQERKRLDQAQSRRRAMRSRAAAKASSSSSS